MALFNSLHRCVKPTQRLPSWPPRQLFSKSSRCLNPNGANGIAIENDGIVTSGPAIVNPVKSQSSLFSPIGLSIRKNAPQNNLDDSFIGLTGGEIFQRMMIRHGVKQIFGYPGGAVLPIFDAIYNCKDFGFTLSRHEQGAGHMAEGYARASGKPGVLLVTSGPGATNLITPMMDALADGTPMVVFCGQVSTRAIGSDGFQEADVLGMSLPCTKWNVSIRKISELPRRINEAFEIASSGRPGPVLVELPIDVTAGILRQPIPRSDTVPARYSTLELAINQANQQDLMHTLERVANLVNIAEKPILYVGQGMLATPQGPDILKELADKASIPVTTSLQGLGAFDETDPKALHMLGLHGSGYANNAMQEADLIIALGARFDDRVTGNITKFAPKAKVAADQGRGGIVHFDILRKNINKVVQATEGVEGDCAENIRLLMPFVQQKKRPQWQSQINDWKTQFSFSLFDRNETDTLVQPQALIERLSDLVHPIKDHTIITTGVGQHQMWAAQHFRWRYPRSMITSGGLGTMGYGLPAAIGAKLARPDAVVIDIDGDASFNMTLNELGTASQYGIDVKIIVLNNEEQGMVTHLQSFYYENRYCHNRHFNPNFVGVAQAMGAQAQRCSNMSEMDTKLKWLLETRGPALLEVMSTKHALCLPMVPAGKALHEFMFYNRNSDSVMD